MRLSGRKTSLFTRPWTQRQRVALLALIGINAALFVAQFFFEAYERGFVNDYLALSDRGVHDAYSWQFVTSMFLHSSPFLFVSNMLIFYLLGRDLESILGQRHFVYLYVAGAAAGEFSHLFLMPSNTVLFAASGGIAAVVAAYATILPELELFSARWREIPLQLKAKHLGYALFIVAGIFLCLDPNGPLTHNAYFSGCLAGFLYAHLLGFGRPSILQLALHQRRIAAERRRQLTPQQIIAEEIDPLLEKIARCGMKSLTRTERRNLARAQRQIIEQTSGD